MEPFIGQVMLFAGNFAPRGFALCQGQLLQISSNQALFSILGTTYGGDGRTTFALPDLRGRAPVSAGQGPGLSDYRLGQKVGVETVALTTQQIPAHNHGVNCATAQGDKGAPAGNFPAPSRNADDIYHAASGGAMARDMVAQTGGGAAHENRGPELVMNWCIALVGIFPSRN